MGILDEAIREHLDLKRRQGAGQDEIQKLEDEAFGPPSRPGDPDFPEQEQVAEPVTGEAEQAPGQVEPPSEEILADPELKAEAPSEEAPVAETPAVPAEPLTPPPASEETTPVEPEAEQPQTEESASQGFFDAEADEAEEDLDLDLELDIDKEIEDVGDLEVEEEPAAPAGEDAPPIHSLDTVEHHFDEAIDEAEVVEDAPPPAEETAPAEPEPDSDEEDEDVLEETPEFLQDTPEDDELWFEQGEPKDFDF